MKANIRIANKQNELKKVIESFELDGTCFFLVHKRLVMALLYHASVMGTGDTDKDYEKGIEFALTEILDYVKESMNVAISRYIADTDDEDDSEFTIEFDGSPNEFREALMEDLHSELAVELEHEFVDFTEDTGISRAEYECNVASATAALEGSGETVFGKFNKMFKPGVQIHMGEDDDGFDNHPISGEPS